jgi:hypothetical protein
LLSGLILVLAIVNAYIEATAPNPDAKPWKHAQVSEFHLASFFLVLSFTFFYTLLTVGLVELAVGTDNHRAAFVSGYLPILYLCSILLLMAIPKLAAAENPPLAVYTFMVFGCAIHVPCVATGKAQLRTFLREKKLDNEPALGVPRLVIRRAILVLVAPLLICIAVMHWTQNHSSLLCVNAGMTGALGCLFYVSK